MSTVMRPILGEMTVSEIRQYCRDHEIKGHSRYTRRAQLVEFVESYLDELDSLLEMDLLEADRSATDGTEDQISPEAIASSQISPDLPSGDRIYPPAIGSVRIIDRTDQYESPKGIWEVSPGYPKSISNRSLGYPRGIPKSCPGHDLVMPKLCPGHDPVMPKLCPGHEPSMIDRYPKSSHGINSAVPGYRIGCDRFSPDQTTEGVRQ